MFRKIAYIFLFAFSSVIIAQSSIPVIPKPKFVLLEKAPSFLITKQTILSAPKGNQEVQYLKEIIKKLVQILIVCKSDCHFTRLKMIVFFLNKSKQS